jgi:cyclopropane fatty-acyl-phospholipid synthase-like methyltransferase
MGSIYVDGTYLEASGSWHEEDSPWKATQVERMLDRHGLQPRTICEVGCGAGEILNQLADRLGPGRRLVGYDISPQAIALARMKTRPELEFVQGDFLAATTPVFDLLMAIDVFEHVEDYIGFLRRLRPRGVYKLFHVPLDMNAQMILRASPIRRVRELVGHLHYFSRDTALATLTDAGYEIVDSFYTASQLELPNLPLKARLAKLPRRLAFAMHPDLAARILGGFSLMVLAR